MGINNFFAAGGVVMYPLLGFSILAVTLIIERISFWVQINNRQSPIVREVLNLYKKNNLVDAINKLRQNQDLPIARIFLAALELEEATPEEFRLALESEAQAEIPLLRRFQTIFDTIISLAPLLGLLGTVLGLITAFASLNLGNVGGTSTTGVTGGYWCSIGFHRIWISGGDWDFTICQHVSRAISTPASIYSRTRWTIRITVSSSL